VQVRERSPLRCLRQPVKPVAELAWERFWLLPWPPQAMWLEPRPPELISLEGDVSQAERELPLLAPERRHLS
jgi:hypothetical protein